MTAPCLKCGFDPGAVVGARWSFFIERRTPSLNDRISNVGTRRFMYRKERDLWCWHFRSMRLEHRIPVARARRRVTLTRLYAGREKERDVDNFVGGLKPVLDAMVSEALLLDDTRRGVEVFYAQRREHRSGLLVELAEFA